MKLTLLLLALNSPPDADHTIRLQTATLYFEEHIAVDPEEVARAAKKRQAWEGILRFIGKEELAIAKPPVQQIQFQQPEPELPWT